MQSSEANMKCSKCTVRFCTSLHICRVVNEHRELEAASCSKTDDDDGFIITFEQKQLLKTMTDICDGGCNCLDVEEHDDKCYKREILLKCAICKSKFNELSDMVEHVEERHPARIVELYFLSSEFYIGYDTPMLLVANFAKKDTDYEVYWLQIQGDGIARYAMLLHQGHAKLKELEEPPEDETAASVHVVEEEDNDNIIDSNVLHIKEITITHLKDNMFKIEVMHPWLRETPGPEQNSLECYLCKKIITSPIKLGSRCHSLCNECEKVVPKVTDKINTKLTNCNMGSLAISKEKTTNCGGNNPSTILCINRNRGCKTNGAEGGMALHAEGCIFQIIGCPWEQCGWTGIQDDILDHWREQHKDMIRWNGIPFHDWAQHFLIPTLGTNFILTLTMDDDSTYYSVYHLTTPSKTTKFRFNLKLSSLKTRKSEEFTGPCLPCTGNDLKKREYLRRTGKMYKITCKCFNDVLWDSGKGYTRLLNIYPDKT